MATEYPPMQLDSRPKKLLRRRVLLDTCIQTQPLFGRYRIPIDMLSERIYVEKIKSRKIYEC